MAQPAPSVVTQQSLDPKVIAALKNVTSPTIANAIEILHVRPKGVGYTDSGIRCLFPDRGPMIGYACTATILSGQPPRSERRVSRTAYWQYMQAALTPKIAVVQDLSENAGGAYWGEVNAHIHMALGCSGVITNGTVRDLEEVRATGFHFFASGVSVSHGYAHLEDFDRPVNVFGMTVNPGDIIHADQHGAVVIPAEVVLEVAAAAKEIETSEKVILNLCKSPAFEIEELHKLISPDY